MSARFGVTKSEFEFLYERVIFQFPFLPLGEKRPGRLVVATTDVKCLLVPLAFLAKHNASNIWGRTVCALDASEPTAEQSFRKFVVDNRWEEYKRSLDAEMFGPSWRRWHRGKYVNTIYTRKSPTDFDICLLEFSAVPNRSIGKSIRFLGFILLQKKRSLYSIVSFIE